MSRRARPKLFENEAAMAAVVVDWLRDVGWHVYQEVQPMRSYAIADIVASKADDILVVEAKLQLTLGVLAQAMKWQAHADQIAVAVPQIAHRTNQFVLTVCSTLGIGLWLVHAPFAAPGDRFYRPGRVTELVRPRRGQGGRDGFLRGVLTPERENYAAAGNANGRRYTPFTATRDALVSVVTGEPGIALNEAVDKIQHHYAGSGSARQSLLYWIKHGKVQGVRAQKTAGKWWLYPVSLNAEASVSSRS